MIRARRDPEAIEKYREVLDETGLLDRPVACLSDEEVVEVVERAMNALMDAAQHVTRALSAMTASFAAFAEKFTEIMAEAVVAEAEQATRESTR